MDRLAWARLTVVWRSSPTRRRYRAGRGAPLRLLGERLENRSLLTASPLGSGGVEPGSETGDPAALAMSMPMSMPMESVSVAPAPVTWGAGLTDPGASSAWDITGMPLGEFHSRLNFVKRATVDPLLAPGNANFWHAHDFFVNPVVDENATLASLMAAGESAAAPSNNLSVYWVPSLFNETSGTFVTPLDSSIAYYSVQKPLEPSKIVAMPAGLSIIAGSAMPTERQPTAVVFWNYIGTSTQYDHIPQGDQWQDLPLQAVIMFPQFWNGASLTGSNFKDHMAYDRGGDGGPSSHPYLLPELQLQIHYGRIPRDARLVLTSDSMTADRPGYAPGWSMHADFIHTPWPERDAAGNLYDGFERRVNDALRWPTVAGPDGNAARPNPRGLQQPFTPVPIDLSPVLPATGAPALPPVDPPVAPPTAGPQPGDPPAPPAQPPNDPPIAMPDGPDLRLAWPTPDVVMRTGVSVGIHGNVTDPEGVAGLRLSLRHESGAYWRPDGTFGEQAWHEGRIVAADGHWRLMIAPPAPGAYALTVIATDTTGATSLAETTFRVIGETLVAPPNDPPPSPPPVIDPPPAPAPDPAPPPVDPPAVALTVADRAFWESARGIGFSVGSLGSLPDQQRLEDALRRVVDLGFTMIRTWGSDTYTGRILATIDRLDLPLQVQAGIWITDDGSARGRIDEALAVIEPYREHVLAVSLGNEQLADWNTSDLTVDQLLGQVAFFRQRSDLPLTYNFSGETFRPWSSFWSQDGRRLLEALDYVNVHSYAGFFDNRWNPAWTPARQLDVLRADEAALATLFADLGLADTPLVLGETGWQAAGADPAVTNAANMRVYYEDVTRYVYGPEARFDAMFYFNLTDEAWKGGDDHWGLFTEGTNAAIGAAKFDVQAVPAILAVTEPIGSLPPLDLVADTTGVSLLVDPATGLAYVRAAGGEPLPIRRADAYWNGHVPRSRGGATLVAAARDAQGRLRVLDVSEWGRFAWILDDSGLFRGEDGPADSTVAEKELLFSIDLDGDGLVGLLEVAEPPAVADQPTLGAAVAVRLMSFNVYYASLGAEWRIDGIATTVADAAPDIASLQEMWGERDAILAAIEAKTGIDYEFSEGSSTWDGDILYRADRWQLLDDGVVPYDGSRGMSHGVFRHRASGAEIMVYGMHPLAGVSEEMHLANMIMATEHMASSPYAGVAPAVLLGDLNAPEWAESQRLLRDGRVDAFGRSWETPLTFADTFRVANGPDADGNTGFGAKIDYVYMQQPIVGGDPLFSVSYASIRRDAPGGSDHFPVLADVLLIDPAG